MDWTAKPYLADNTVHCCDWRELLEALPDGSVDLVLTDPPYNLMYCSWETTIDWPHWWSEIARVLAPCGVVVMTAMQPFTSELVMSNKAWFRYEWAWIKNAATRFLDANKKPMRRHEDVVVFSPVGAGSHIYNPQKDFDATRNSGRRKAHLTNGSAYRTKAKTGWKEDGWRYPTTDLYFPIERLSSNRGSACSLHPTAKPVPLFEYLIKTYTNTGMLVVDPFVGSGTTAVAARITGRRYICDDMLAEYVDIARRRVEPTFGEPPRRAGVDIHNEVDINSLPLFSAL